MEREINKEVLLEKLYLSIMDYICSLSYEPEEPVGDWVEEHLECLFSQRLPERERTLRYKQQVLDATRSELDRTMDVLRQYYSKLAMLRRVEHATQEGGCYGRLHFDL